MESNPFTVPIHIGSINFLWLAIDEKGVQDSPIDSLLFGYPWKYWNDASDGVE